MTTHILKLVDRGTPPTDDPNTTHINRTIRQIEDSIVYENIAATLLAVPEATTITEWIGTPIVLLKLIDLNRRNEMRIYNEERSTIAGIPLRIEPAPGLQLALHITETNPPTIDREAVMIELAHSGWHEDTTDTGQGYWYKNDRVVAERRSGPPIPYNDYIEIRNLIMEVARQR